MSLGDFSDQNEPKILSMFALFLCVAADMCVCRGFAKWSANQIENSLIGREGAHNLIGRERGGGGHTCRR